MISHYLTSRILPMLAGLAFVFVHLSQPANAQSTKSNNVNLHKIPFGFSSNDKQACPPPKDSEIPSAELSILLKKSQDEGRYCDAATFAYQLKTRSKKRDERIRLAEIVAEELLRAQDYRSAVILTLREINENPPSRPSAHLNLRLYTLRAVFAAAMEVGTDKDSQWIEYGLGFKDHDHPMSQFLQYDSFLRDFPKSNAKNEVENMKEQILASYIARELHIAEILVKRDQFMAAIIRLERLYENELISESKHLPKLMTTVIRYQDLFADEIAHPPWIRIGYKWPDHRLRDVFRMPHDAVVNRSELAELLLKKSRQACDFLKTNFPDHSESCQ